MQKWRRQFAHVVRFSYHDYRNGTYVAWRDRLEPFTGCWWLSGSGNVNQLTVRGFDDQLADGIRRLAKREGISLNQAALKLLRKGAGLADPGQGPDNVGSSLDHLIGSWNDDEADELDATL